jgi:hypothetical protein
MTIAWSSVGGVKMEDLSEVLRFQMVNLGSVKQLETFEMSTNLEVGASVIYSALLQASPSGYLAQTV